MTSKTTYKQTEIGEIPEDWKIGRLGDYCDVKGGKRLPKGESLVGARTSHPYIRIKDITEDGINKSNLLYLTESTHKKINRYIINEGDVYISIVGTIGLSGIIDKELNGANLTENAARLFNFDGLNPKYLSYFFKSPTGQRQIKSRTVGSTQSKLALFRINDIIFPLVKLKEQQQIVSVLSSLDDKIELNRKINKTLEGVGKALFKRWFVDFEFPSDNGKPYKSSGGEMVDSELGEIPKEWRAGTFGEGVKILDSKRIPLSSREREKRKGIYPYYGATEIMDFVDDYIFDGIYLLVGEDGSVIKEDGTPFIQYVWGKFWANNHAHVLQGTSGFSTEYLLILLSSTNITPFVTGAVQLKLNQENMKSIPMVIPPNGLMEKFNTTIEGLYDRIRLNFEQIRMLTQIRDSLLPRLMSGKLRVKDYENN